MLAPLLALAIAATPSFDRSFSLSLRGERVGALHVRFDGQQFRYESLTVVRRGAQLATERFGATTDEAGRGSTDAGRQLAGPMPSTLALWQFHDGDRHRCLDAEDERDGKRGQVCASRDGRNLAGTLLGEPFTALLDGDGGPDVVELPGQKTRFEIAIGPMPLPVPRDLFAASMPARDLAPLDGTARATVVGKGDGCDVRESLVHKPPPRDAPLRAPEGDWQPDAKLLRLAASTRWAAAIELAQLVNKSVASVPASLPDEDPRTVWAAHRGSCVGQARVFAELARARGLPARVVIGALLEDGQVSAHAWDEVELEGHWYGVDPSRGVAPVGPRWIPFAREGDADPLRAGRCLLALPTMRWTVDAQ